ncbi:MAG: hypothetical protein AAF845_06170 [Bacteroidota bacterium]
MNLPRALLAGAFGGIVASVVMAVARRLGADLPLEILVGTVVLDPGPGAWALGFAVHVAGSAVIGLAYAWGFEVITKRATMLSGAVLSVIHLLGSGVAVGAVLPAVHPLVPEAVAAPGFFFARLGAGAVVAYGLAHLVFGAAVGALYRNQVRRPRLTA